MANEGTPGISDAPNPQWLLEKYGSDAAVRIGEVALTLGGAIQAERAFCPAKPDPEKPGLFEARRTSWLAKALMAGGSLHPDDLWLTED